MKILQRHYMKELAVLFLTMTAGLGLIFSLIDLINRMADFIPHKPAIRSLLLYAAYSIPQYILYLMPMAALISGLFVFSHAVRKRETIAIRAAGGRMRDLLRPFVLSGILLSVAGFAVSEFATPVFLQKAHRLRDAIIKKENVLAFRNGTVWLRSRDYVVKMDIYNPEKGQSKGVSIFRIENDTVKERIEAATAEWKPALTMPGGASRGEWFLRDARKYDIESGMLERQKEMQLDIPVTPDTFREGVKGPDEMNILELLKYSKRLRESGFRNVKPLVYIYSKASFPLVNLIMLILGISLAMTGKHGSGLITAAIGIGISLLYWVGFTTALSLGYTGLLPPLAATWLMPVIFGTGAFYLFRKIPE